MPSGVNEVVVKMGRGYLIWAGANVSTSGSFATNATAYGNLFQYAGALSVCPTGWRLPDYTETAVLMEGSVTTNTFSSSGMQAISKYDPTNSGILRIPLAGWARSGLSGTQDAGKFGITWSSTNLETDSNRAYCTYFGLIGDGSVWKGQTTTGIKSDYFSVRCVRDCYRGYAD